MFKALSNDAKGVVKIWSKYWTSYGGSSALFTSAYFYAALVLTMVNFGAWYHSGWWELVISMLPNILGFTLAGLAVFLSMDSGFSKFLAGAGSGGVSPFSALVSAFVHFIVVQAAALIFALTVKSSFFVLPGLPDMYYKAVDVGNKVVWFFGYFIFMYAIVLVFSAVFAVFRAAQWYEQYISKIKQGEGER